jgi:hypothetical protein
MGRPRYSALKRQRELRKQLKREQKAARRQARREAKHALKREPASDLPPAE